MNKKSFGLSLVSSALMALAVVVSCTVTDGNGDDANGAGDCTAGRSVPCTCPGGDKGTQVCNSSGTGYGLCDCEGGGEAGAPSTSNGGAGAEPGNYGGDGYGGYGGEGWVPASGAGGVASAEGGAGGADPAVAGAGGAGGSAEPGLCEEQSDPCESCYHTKCCAELTACLDVTQCVDEFIALRACSVDFMETNGGHASPAEIDSCGDPNGGWTGNHHSTTIALFDCMNGKIPGHAGTGAGWENLQSWDIDAMCVKECYGAE